DRSGVSASPARSFDAYTDGARSGKLDVFTEGANV
ncbi:copper resistance protein CopQ, partial [Cupriavidus basilensis]|nr:copper resistance protein CopQ [Cupriavidus basilensis]